MPSPCTVSVILPTFNSAQTLGACLESIRDQDYPTAALQVILVDGGSDDDTLTLARDFGVETLIHNPQRAEEYGRILGLSAARGQILAFIDADNVLDSSAWLRRMTAPFEQPHIVGAEPLHYAARPGDGLITRYCGLIGGDDPVAVYLGHYDRFCAFTGRWTDSAVRQIDRGDYLEIELDERDLPPMGANGFLVRKAALEALALRQFVHTEVLRQLVAGGHNTFAKVKVGVVHLHADSLRTFVRKKVRRIRRRLSGELPGETGSCIRVSKVARICLSSALIVPLFMDAYRGYRRQPDTAWLFHPVACWVVVAAYALSVLRHILRFKSIYGALRRRGGGLSSLL